MYPNAMRPVAAHPMTYVTQRQLPLVVLAALALAACGKEADGATADSTAAQAVTIGPEAVSIVRADTIMTGPAVSGTLTPEREARIRAQLGGPVLQVLVEPGERVGRGAVLARLDAAAVRDALLGARAGVTAAQSSHDLARRELERAQRLVKEGAIAQRDLEGAQRAAVAAQAQLADARARAQAAEDQAGRAAITAPFAGIVSERSVSSGDVVAPGAPLFTVVDPSTMRFEASVPAEELATVRVGAPVRFTVSGYGDRAFTGKITRVNPTADPTTRQVRLLVTIPNTGASPLVGGLFAEGRVASDGRSGLIVPENAIDQRGVTPTVVRVRGGRTELVSVELGIRDAAAERMEITKGVAAGDTLLLGAARGITAGTMVKVSEPADRGRAMR